MKKLLVLLTAVLLSLCLFGCGGDNSTSLDMGKATSSLDSEMTNMSSLDDSELQIIYGLDTSLLDDYTIKSSTLANGNFYAILKVNSDNKAAVKDQMKNMFAVMEKQSDLYSPDAITLIKNHLETSIGDYLIYIVGSDTDALYEIVKGCVK